MEIIRTNIDDKKALYRMAHQDSKKPAEHIGEVVEVLGWAYVDDVNKKSGEPQKVLYLDTDSGTFGTISPTFVEAFLDIVETFGNDFRHIEVCGGVSKNGRNFVSCNLVD